MRSMAHRQWVQSRVFSTLRADHCLDLVCLARPALGYCERSRLVVASSVRLGVFASGTGAGDPSSHRCRIRYTACRTRADGGGGGKREEAWAQTSERSATLLLAQTFRGCTLDSVCRVTYVGGCGRLGCVLVVVAFCWRLCACKMRVRFLSHTPPVHGLYVVRHGKSQC